MDKSNPEQMNGYAAARLALMQEFRSRSLEQRFAAVEDMIELTDAILDERRRNGKKIISHPTEESEW
ncbi:MAG: hypothetical protein WD572_08125 [Gammaproteobacteria bacterium]